MKIRVISEFIDKHTKELHPKDAVLFVSEERFSEIKKAGDFVELINEESQEEKPAEDTEETIPVMEEETPKKRSYKRRGKKDES